MVGDYPCDLYSSTSPNDQVKSQLLHLYAMPIAAPIAGSNTVKISPKAMKPTPTGQNRAVSMAPITTTNRSQQPISVAPARAPMHPPAGGVTAPSPQRGQGIHSFFSSVRPRICARKASETLGSFSRLMQRSLSLNRQAAVDSRCYWKAFVLPNPLSPHVDAVLM